MSEPTNKQEKTAAKVGAYLEKVCQSEGCDIAVWLSWGELLRLVDVMKSNPQVNELKLDLQIRWSDGITNQTETNDTGGA